MTAVAPIRIIGGGMMGLTTALRFAKKGYPVIVHERDPYFGGLSSGSELGGVPVERFYHCVLPTDTALLALLDELGLSEKIHWQRTRTGFFWEGKLVEMTTTADLLRFPPLRLIDRLRLGWTVFYSGQHTSAAWFDNEALSPFLKRHGGERLFRTIWEPLLLAKLGPEYDRFSAGFIWATIRRMLSARKHQNRAEQLGFVSGRYEQVFAAMREALRSAGAEVVADSDITALSRASGSSHRWDVHTKDGTFPADGVILCTPAPLAARLLNGIYPLKTTNLHAFAHLGVVCEVLLLKRSLTPYYVLNLAERGLPFTGVIELTNLTGTKEFAGYTVVYLPRYAGRASSVWDMDDTCVHDENIKGLRLVIPGFEDGDVHAWQINRARYVQPVHEVGGMNSLPPLSVAPGLAFLSTVQMAPWPVFNDAVVRHVDDHLPELFHIVHKDQ